MLTISISLFVINSIIGFHSKKDFISISWSNNSFKMLFISTICIGLALLTLLIFLKCYWLITVIYSFELLKKLHSQLKIKK